tara:strand:- start:4607 stop:5269 length:663 start_codon:yes stop_codon:yes gene_type:complete
MYYYPNTNNDYFDDSGLTNSTDSQETDDNTSLIIDLYGEGHFDSDNSDNDNSDMDSNYGIIYDIINVEDAQHFYSEKIHNKYYIGLSHIYTHNNTQQLLLSASVSAPIFFKHSYDNINDYLYYYGLTRITNHQVQILQVDIIQEGYLEIVTVLNKTYWLRLVQRHWKNIYRQRKTVIQQRILPENLFYNEVNGNYPISISYLPSLYGMLSQYNNTNQLID